MSKEQEYRPDGKRTIGDTAKPLARVDVTHVTTDFVLASHAGNKTVGECVDAILEERRLHGDGVPQKITVTMNPDD